jgi:hypothetical protein
MRTYKTWEIIKMLSENPNLRFKAMPYSEDKTFFDEACLVNGVLCWGGNKAYPLQIAIGKYDIDWQLVETPVTWQEALQAWAEEKTVICKFNDINEEYSEICFSNDYDTHLTRYQILYGQWFIVPEGVD